MRKPLALEELLKRSQWDLTQEDAYSILAQLKNLLARSSVDYLTNDRMRRKVIFALCELYKALLNKDYVDACGIVYYLSETHSLESHVVGTIVYKALEDILGDN